MKRKTDFICNICRTHNKKKTTHPSHMHIPGICDCECRNQ